MNAEHVVLAITLASLMPVATLSAMLGSRIHRVRHASGACTCDED